jgi:hypothetical protein
MSCSSSAGAETSASSLCFRVRHVPSHTDQDNVRIYRDGGPCDVAARDRAQLNARVGPAPSAMRNISAVMGRLPLSLNWDMLTYGKGGYRRVRRCGLVRRRDRLEP